ncbi:Gfo/Idh/MocA family protein [Aquiflexum sp.]|uniref:Gfo/Idh/MocA family protein n=1 Tax=Aquiflexum sp. TaxID=1872584 RepID=UPI0035944F9A
MKKLKGAIIGSGYFSQYHGDAWTRIPQVEIVAVCDKDEQKAALFSKNFGINKIYTDLETMLDREKPDFLDIVTPPVTHKSIIQSAVSRGIHVICQKPLAETFEEVLEIREILKNADARFMVHENWRFQPWYREIKSLLEQGAVGENRFQYFFKMRTGDGWREDAYLDRQPYFRKMPRLLMHETGVHFVDTFRYLEGEITEVFANLKTLNPNIKGEDAGLIFFRFKSGCTALLDANRYNEPFHENPRFTFGEMAIEGNKGSLELNHKGKITVKPLGRSLEKLPFKPSSNGFSGDSVYHCQKHFIENLFTDSPFETNLDDYLKTLQVVEAIYQSHYEGRKISVSKLDLNQLSKSKSKI